MKLDRERLTHYPRMFVFLYVVIGGWWLSSGTGLLDRAGKNIGVDFVTFWAASKVTIDGRPELVYDVRQMQAPQEAAVDAHLPLYAFHYPPTFLLFLLPLSLVPYLPSFFLWVGAGLTAFLLLARRIAPDPATAGLALAFPGVFQNVFQGQNGLYTTTLLGTGLYLLDGSPVLAGAVLGLLSFKPHLAPVVAVVLVAARRWRALAAAGASAGMLSVVSWILLGSAPWHAFVANMPFAVQVLETPGVLPWIRMPTVQVAAMLLGSPASVARAIQGTAAVVAIIGAALVWARGSSLPSRVMALVGAAFLVTPFAFDYDTAMLALPAAWLGFEGARNGFRRGELALVVAAWSAPLSLPAIAAGTSIQLGPVLSASLLWAAWKRG